MPNRIRVDTTPPRVVSFSARPLLVSPDGDGRFDRAKIRYRISERGVVELYVGGMRALRKSGTRTSGTLDWFGIAGGRGAPRAASQAAARRTRPGREPRARARAHVRSGSASSRSGARESTSRPGGRFAILALSQARTLRWRLGDRSGTARPGTVRLVAPAVPGRYTLRIEANGHVKRAAVVVRGFGAVSTAAQLASVVGCLGLATLLLAPARSARAAGLLAWGAGLGVLGVYLLPDLSRTRLVAAAVGGLAVAVGVAILLRYRPYALAFATLACVPLRTPVDIGTDEVNLLLPLYAVIAGLALSLAWTLLRGDERTRELGPVALPVAAFVVWTGLSMLWTIDVRRGAIFLGAFVLPFGLLAVGFARLPWRGRWLTWLWSGLVATALAYAAVGGYQWLTRDVFWNPSVKVFNAYAPFFRVNSVFWDPSVYGRYLTVAILASLAGILLGGVRGWRVAGLYAVVVGTWLGLVISFSQSSFVALAAGIVVAVAVAWGRRATLALVGLGVVTLAVLFTVPQIRDEVVGKSRSGFNRITSGRANLVGQGARIALDHPVAGVGAGGFSREYARRLGIPGRTRSASRRTRLR